MKVLYLSPIGLMGGAERCLATLMAAVREVRPDAQLELVCASDGPLLSRAGSIGAPARLLPMPRELAELGDSSLSRNRGGAESARLLLRTLTALPATRRYLKRLREVVAEIRPDLIHSNGLKTHLLASLLPRRSPPTVWHMHDFLAERPAMSRLLRWTSFRCDGIIAISEAIARDVRTVLSDAPVRVIYNAIDVDYFTPAPNEVGGGAFHPTPDAADTDGAVADLDRLAGLPPAFPGTVRIGLVATYARWKGQDLLLESAARYFQQWPQAAARFYIVGGPIYRTRNSQFSIDELKRHAESLQLGQRIGFIDFQSDPRAVYRALDVVVHASTRPEPFGLTIAEAMACGRPLVISCAGGAAELFTPDVDAVGVSPRDAFALAAAIRRLITDPNRRMELARNARQTALRRFNPDRLGKQIVAFYEEILSGGLSGTPAPARAGSGRGR